MAAERNSGHEAIAEEIKSYVLGYGDRRTADRIGNLIPGKFFDLCVSYDAIDFDYQCHTFLVNILIGRGRSMPWPIARG